MRLFDLNAITAASKGVVTYQTFDSRFEDLLDGVIEYRLMRDLSPIYRAVEVTERDGRTELLCRDLRIRNFGGRFGQLDVTLDAEGKPARKVFHV